jgi:hypothetical protein
MRANPYIIADANRPRRIWLQVHFSITVQSMIAINNVYKRRDHAVRTDAYVTAAIYKRIETNRRSIANIDHGTSIAGANLHPGLYHHFPTNMN